MSVHRTRKYEHAEAKMFSRRDAGTQREKKLTLSAYIVAREVGGWSGNVGEWRRRERRLVALRSWSSPEAENKNDGDGGEDESQRRPEEELALRAG